MRNVKLTLAYDGGEFHGWQTQPGLRTVQQTLTEAIERVCAERVIVHGSGRTDAGVHALAQIAHFHLTAPLPLENLGRALNAVLPRAIRVTAAEEVPLSFHARRDALSKSYLYRIWRRPVCPPFLRLYVYHFPYALDEAWMIDAAPCFEGAHDFTSFAARPDASQPGDSGNLRTVLESRLCREGEELLYRVRGRGFLHHMVRNMMGFLIDVGRGTHRARELSAVLAARRRAAAGRMAPAHGLYLESVEYPAHND